MRLYEKAIVVVCRHFEQLNEEVNALPVNICFDVLYQLHVEKRYSLLSSQIVELNVFSGLLLLTNGRRQLLHRCFQSLMDNGTNVASRLVTAFCQTVNHGECSGKTDKLGFALCTFLSEGGWFVESGMILKKIICLQSTNAPQITPFYFDCYVKLLQVNNNYCRFEECGFLVDKIQCLIDTLALEQNNEYNVPQAFAEFSQFYFIKSQYDEAYKWSIRALKLLTSTTPSLTVIDVLRQSAKACVVKREFKGAELFIKQALLTVKDVFKIEDPNWSLEYLQLHPKIADVFLDYGFYLLNVDLINQSVVLYRMALKIRKLLFDREESNNISMNLCVALAHEELAYATYVYEYSSGEFDVAKEHIDTAIMIMDCLLPVNHLRLASAKRVKALITEEIAVDHHDKVIAQKMLQESQELHFAALNTARNAFGEMNVQTAKHYGNLGRLYQSMHRFVEAEQMHIKAIGIKERLLGSDDYEVGLSLGHLASLYNYDLLMFEKAEHLYLKSLAIGIKLFGECYSGLEYDYRGLLRVYSNLNNNEKVDEYNRIFNRWLLLREKVSVSKEECPLLSILSMEKLKTQDLYYIFEYVVN